ncbi:hypothetical protein ALO68_102318 [Pseudomonas syringae pv. helianthi]|uniref:Uncharacterized protein n=1 Tax=Pseudomonas syringae pv. helianthi TaxID=251654 RepID=A0A0P9RJ70_9PSED|nr:hypothetical protein ALO68_102318 [Pseudomonas syringae pv. helianthi]
MAALDALRPTSSHAARRGFLTRSVTQGIATLEREER